MGKLTLILGGIKTGKTRFAQGLAEKAEVGSSRIAYLATARAWDDEMTRRIAHHRADRPGHWLTMEEPIDAAGIIASAGGGSDLILLDCLTMLMTNWLMEVPVIDGSGEDEMGSVPDREKAESYFSQKVDELLKATADWKGEIIIISNLVENGLVSTYPFTRMYQDLAGMTHQKIAAQAETVVQMIAGIPQYLKGGPCP